MYITVYCCSRSRSTSHSVRPSSYDDCALPHYMSPLKSMKLHKIELSRREVSSLGAPAPAAAPAGGASSAGLSKTSPHTRPSRSSERRRGHADRNGNSTAASNTNGGGGGSGTSTPLRRPPKPDTGSRAGSGGTPRRSASRLMAPTTASMNRYLLSFESNSDFVKHVLPARFA